MDEEKAGIEQYAAASGPDQKEANGRVSTGRKVRLAVLIGVLLAMGAATFALKFWERSARETRLREAAEKAAELRQAIRELDWGAEPAVFRAAWERAELLLKEVLVRDPSSMEGWKLAVPLFFSKPDMENACRAFAKIDQSSLPVSYGEGIEALQPFPRLLVEAVSSELTGPDVAQIERTRRLWLLAKTITSDCEGGAARAIALCRWMAVNFLTETAGTTPGDPVAAALRGYGSPAEAAWLFCELARQAGLETELYALDVTDANWRYLVEVRPSGTDPFMVNPALAVPLVDPSSGALLSRSAAIASPEALAKLRELAGEEPRVIADALAKADAKAACHPSACFQRFAAFDYLLSELPTRPVLALDFRTLPAGTQVELWPEAVRIAIAMAQPGYDAAASLEHPEARIADTARKLQVGGACDLAAKAYAELQKDTAAKLRDADVPQAVEMLKRTAAYLAAFAAINLADARDPGAAEALRTCIAESADGLWIPLVTARLADVVEAAGDAEGAAALRGELTGPRRLFGILTARGLWPGQATVRPPQ